MTLGTLQLQLMRCIYFVLLYQIYDKSLYLYLRERMSCIGYPGVNSLNRENYERNTKGDETRLYDDSFHQLEDGHPAAL